MPKLGSRHTSRLCTKVQLCMVLVVKQRIEDGLEYGEKLAPRHVGVSQKCEGERMIALFLGKSETK